MARRVGAEADARMLTPVVYRASPACARMMAQAGWSVSRHGQEAILPLDAYDPDTPARRGLRRKLRQARRAGVTLTRHAPGTLPLAPLEPVSRAWLARKGGAERGFALGRFEPAYLARMDLVLARVEGRIVGFASLWVSGDGAEWSVDLMRVLPEAPDGTMHALVDAGIALARERGARRFSLCSVPLAGLGRPVTWPERVGHRIWTRRGAALGLHGLWRFKAMFDPQWEDRYVATRSPRDMPCAVMGIRRLIG